MQLDLVDGGRHPRLVDQPLQMLRLEVRHPDRARPALFLDPDEGAPSVEIQVLLRRRPVDQIEVDRLQAQAVQALVEGRERRVVALVVVPQLRGQEHRLAPKLGRRDPLAHPPLVGVGRRRIDRSIAGLQRRPDHRRGVVLWRAPDPQSELRHHAAIVQRHMRLLDRHRVISSWGCWRWPTPSRAGFALGRTNGALPCKVSGIPCFPSPSISATTPYLGKRYGVRPACSVTVGHSDPRPSRWRSR